MPPSLQTKKHYLSQLDLSYICAQMCAPAYPLPRWQPELAKHCELLYKRFLWLHIKYPQTHLVPTRDIDEFWHNHILHTQSYTRDCNALFGHYLHHNPSDGSEQQTLLEGFLLTKRYYQDEFKQNLTVLQRKK